MTLYRTLSVVVDEPGNPAVGIRSIRAAVLREFSVVTNPAYDDAAVELRNDLTGSSRIPGAETLWL